MNHSATWPLILLSLLIGAQSHGQSTDGGRTELTVFGGYGFGGHFLTESGQQANLDGGNDLGIIVDFEYDASAQWEFFYLQQDTSVDTAAITAHRRSVDTDIRFLQGGGTYRGTGEKVRGYLAGTVGLTHIDPHGPGTDSDLFWSLSIGGGAQFRAAEHLSFRLEGRLFGTFVNANTAVFCGSGLETGQCLFQVRSDVLWQSHVFAGITFRF